MSVLNRKYNRIILPKSKRVDIQVRLEDGSNTVFNATVMNFSEGGFGLSVKRNDKLTLKKSFSLTVVDTSENNLGDLSAIQMEIKWILDDPQLSRLGFGCMFTQLPVGTREYLRDAVENWGDL